MSGVSFAAQHPGALLAATPALVWRSALLPPDSCGTEHRGKTPLSHVCPPAHGTWAGSLVLGPLAKTASPPGLLMSNTREEDEVLRTSHSSPCGRLPLHCTISSLYLLSPRPPDQLVRAVPMFFTETSSSCVPILFGEDKAKVKT